MKPNITSSMRILYFFYLKEGEEGGDENVGEKKIFDKKPRKRSKIR